MLRPAPPLAPRGADSTARAVLTRGAAKLPRQPHHKKGDGRELTLGSHWRSRTIHVVLLGQAHPDRCCRLGALPPHVGRWQAGRARRVRFLPADPQGRSTPGRERGRAGKPRPPGWPHRKRSFVRQIALRSRGILVRARQPLALKLNGHAGQPHTILSRCVNDRALVHQCTIVIVAFFEPFLSKINQSFGSLQLNARGGSCSRRA